MVNPKSHFGNQFQAVRTRPPCASRSHQVMKKLGPTFAVAAGLLALIVGQFWVDGPPSTFAQTDTTAPTVSSVAISSDTGDDGVYGIGDKIEVTVTFSENVTLTGSPLLELTIGTSARNAAYKSTTGSKVVFSYTVAVGDSDVDGISIAADKLGLNGGTIKDAAENDADLSHSAVSALAGHKVDGIRPTITSVYLIGSSSGQDGVHTIGEYLPAGVRFSEHVYVGGYPGPRMKLNFEGATKSADFGGAYPQCNESICVDGPGGLYGISVEFEYMIAKGDLDLDGVAINANSVVLNGSSIRDGAGNDAVLSHSADAEDSNYIVDGVPATVRSVAITSDPGSDNTYGVGDTIEVNVTFSESVSVPRWFGSGGVVRMPRLELNIGGVTKSARTHERGNITGTALVFSYTVQDGDNDANGISIGANALTLKYGGSIRDANGTCCPGGNNADLTHSAVAESARHKVRTLTQPSKSSDATLSALTLSGIDIGAFSSGTTSYTADVANSVTETTVTPTVSHSGATHVIELDGVEDADGVVSLAAGSNVITIEVTAEDDTTTRTYTVTVTRLVSLQQNSTDATLSALTLSGINFGAFSSNTDSYTASVAYSVSQTTVTPTVNDSGATYVINLGGVTDADGVVSLSVGSNVITVEVTAEDDDTTRTYTVAVTRAEPPSTDAKLSALTLSGIVFGTFDSTTTTYSAQVANSVSQTTVTPTVNDSGATYVIKLGGVTDADGVVLLSVGSNVITAEVTAEDDSTTQTYTVTVTRAAPPSTDATLSALTLSGIDFGTFAPGTTSYTAQVANSVSQTTVTPTVNDSGASYIIKLGGVTDVDGIVPLSVGSNVITVQVSAEDDSTTKTYTVTVTRAEPPSTDATLSALTLSGINFGAFSSATSSYTASVANSVTETTVTPTVNHSGATYVIKLGGVTDADGVVSLSVGSNVITVEVTAEDDDTTRTYTVAVTRAEPPSTDATLSALTLSGIDFGTFDSTTTTYSAQVANSVSQTTVTPTVNDSGASYVIKLGGVTDADGVVSLSVGSNVITVEVTAEDDDTTRTYTVAVTRAEPPSTDATLSALSLSGIDFGTFDSSTTTYSAQVANTVSQTTVTPTVNDSGATYVIKLGGVTDADGVVSLSVGSNVITVEVTAEDDSTTKTYTVTVTRAEPPSTDATLSALTLSDVPFGTFASGTMSYSAQVANTVSQTTVTPTVNDSGATYVIKLSGVTDADGVVSLSVGRNAITVEVTAEDDSTTKTYTVTVTRAEPPSTDATLSALTLSGIVFGTFDSTTTTYSAQVANSVTETTVTPTVNDSGATYVIKLGGVTDAGGVVSLSVGSNVITVQVSAEDDSTTKTYTVTVTRAEPPSTDATLSALTLSGIDFGTFASGTASYSAQVANTVSQTTVTPTVNDSGASYVIKLGGVTDADGVVSLSVGSNVITVEVTAEDDDTTRTYTVAVTRAEPPSTDATLSALTLSGIVFGTFDSTTTTYSAQVANSVSQTTVTLTVNDSGASYVIKLGGVTDADGVVSLSVGSNVITVQVSAEDDSTTKTYTVTVTRAEPPSTDATLSALTLSDVPLGTFASGTTSYSAQVANSVSQTTVAPTVKHSGASYVIKLGGVTDADGVVSLSVGSNVITVEVTAEDGETTQTYTVTVTRAAPPSMDATLSALSLSGIDFGTFDSSTTTYSAQVANTVSQTTVTPTVNDSGASYVIKLGGMTNADGVVSLSVGSNVITVKVTAEDDDTTRTYTVTLTRAEPPSTDATLSALTLSGIDFGTFASGTASYSAQVASSVSQTTVTPTLNDSGASYVIKLDGVTDVDGVVSLNAGSNVITVEVSAEDDETTQTYTVTVSRAEPPTPELSDDATLSSLTLSGIDFGTFDSTTTSYTAQVANAVSQTTVTPTVNHAEANNVIKLGGVTDADGVVSLSLGTNAITVEVTAEDGETTHTYTVTVTRAAPPSTDATLSALSLSGIDFGTFDSSITTYSAQVANTVSRTTVTPTVNDSEASYVIKLGGATDADGVVSLSVGSNVITVEVTAEDENTTQAYTVTVTRAAPLSTDATLSALTLSGIDFGTFDSSATSYAAQVANDVTHTTVTPTVNHSGATYVIKLDGVTDADGVVLLSVGSNVITIEVTAEDDKTTQTYSVTVTRTAPPALDATLSALTLSGIDFGTFASGTTSYTAQVANSVSQTTVTPTVNHAEASYVIKLDGVTDADGVVLLSVGSNVITVEVTAEDDSTTQTYTVTVTRAAPESNRERLRNLYDSNDDGVIDRDETIAAIRDYFAGDLTRDETIEVIKLYFSSST